MRGQEAKSRALPWNTYLQLTVSEILNIIFWGFFLDFFFRTSPLKRVTKHTSAAQHGTNGSVRQSTKWTEREPGGRSVGEFQVNWCVHKKWQMAQKAQGSCSRKDGEAVQAPGGGIKVWWGCRARGATRAQIPLFIPPLCRLG